MNFLIENIKIRLNSKKITHKTRLIDHLNMKIITKSLSIIVLDILYY